FRRFSPGFSASLPIRAPIGANAAPESASFRTTRQLGTRCDLERVTFPCPSRAPASLGPGLRTASRAKGGRGGPSPSRAGEHHVHRRTNEPQKQARRRTGGG